MSKKRAGRQKNSRAADDSVIAAALQENEKRANRMAVYLFVVGLVLVIANIALNHFGIFRLKSTQNLETNIVSGVCCILPIIAYLVRCFPQRVMRWINMVFIVLFSARLDLAIGYNATLIMAVPMVMAVAYFSVSTTIITYLVTAVAFAASAFIGAAGFGLLDANHVKVPAGTVLTVETTLKQALTDIGVRNAQYVRDMMMLGYLPKLLLSLLLLVLAVAITRFGHTMLLRQAHTGAEQARAGAELKLAGALQASALPAAEKINGKYNFEISAGMTAARETGGDFYDFTMIDDTHLALVIAEVCGKGIAAAMFMMSAKEKLRAALATDRTPGEILFEVNNRLFENNKKLMFVTVWLGVLDITTGELVTANAGHEDPIMKLSGRSFVSVSELRGCGVGVQQGKTFPEQRYWLSPGDILVLCTDGVTAAQRKDGESYGINRLVSRLNLDFPAKTAPAEAVRTGLLQRLSEFVDGAEQADDITTLVLRFFGGK